MMNVKKLNPIKQNQIVILILDFVNTWISHYQLDLHKYSMYLNDVWG